MTDFPALFAGLVDDAAMFPPGNADVADAAAAHRDYRRSWFAPMVGPLVVSDQRLGELGRALLNAGWTPASPGEGLDVSVVNSSGAGGLLSLAGRQTPGVQMLAVESALRDLDDLAANASRVLSAASELDESVQVFVELPYAPGWERAVEVVEASGLFGKIRTGGTAPTDTPSTGQLARQLSVLVEADLPFKATAGLHRAWPAPGSQRDRPAQHGFLTLLAAVDALVAGATEEEAADLLSGGDRPAVLESLVGWNDARSTGARRRLRSFGCCGVLDPLGDLVALGLLRAPA